MIPPIHAGYEDAVRMANQHATAEAIASLIATVLAGVLLLWWKFHRIGMSWKQFRAEMKTPTPPAVYVPPAIRLEFVQVAPPVEPASYRDDTGTQVAEA